MWANGNVSVQQEGRGKGVEQGKKGNKGINILNMPYVTIPAQEVLTFPAGTT